MNPMLVTAMAHQMETERRRECRQAALRSLARQDRRTRAKNSSSRRIAATNAARRRLVPRLPARLAERKKAP